jgi:hypothetical protein
MKTTIVALLLVGLAIAADKPKNFYKIAHISQSVVAISCPGNGGDPAVVKNIDGVLLISCGTKGE